MNLNIKSDSCVLQPLYTVTLNCAEAENKSKHKKRQLACYNLYSIVTNKHYSLACGIGFEPHMHTQKLEIRFRG